MSHAFVIQILYHSSGVFGDFSDLKCLYHIEPVDSISDEVRNIIKMFTSLHLATDTTNSYCL